MTADVIKIEDGRRRLRSRREAAPPARCPAAPFELALLASMQVGIVFGMAMWAWADRWGRR